MANGGSIPPTSTINHREPTKGNEKMIEIVEIHRVRFVTIIRKKVTSSVTLKCPCSYNTYMKKTWVNVFTAVYDNEEIQLSTPYATEADAIRGIRPSMKRRYKTTINLAELLIKALEPKEIPVFAQTKEANEFLHKLNDTFNKILYTNYGNQ